MRTVASTLPSFDTYLSMWSEYFIKIWIKKKKKKKQFPINFQSQINLFFSKDIFINCKKVNMMNMILADRCTFKKEKKYKKCLLLTIFDRILYSGFFFFFYQNPFREELMTLWSWKIRRNEFFKSTHFQLHTN